MAGTAFDDVGRPILNGRNGDKPPARDWPAIIGTLVVTITAISGYAYHVESALAALSVSQAQAVERGNALQRQLDDSIARAERHNDVIDKKLDNVTELVGRAVTNLDDLRHELKR